MILEAKSTVTCPRDQKEVSVRKDCVGISGPGCPEFKHINVSRWGISVACKHGEPKEEQIVNGDA